MTLPFTTDAFLDVFGAFNSQWLWMVAVLWLLTMAFVFQWVRRREVSERAALALLSLHWAWSGVVYHWGFFRTINPAATAFGAAFLLQAAYFGWLSLGDRAAAAGIRGARGILGVVFLLYSLAYPFIGLMVGLRYPRLPLFAVPCPTTLLTAGVLLIATGIPRVARVIPVLWACLGASAVLALGIWADAGLIAAALFLTVDLFKPAILERSVATT